MLLKDVGEQTMININYQGPKNGTTIDTLHNTNDSLRFRYYMGSLNHWPYTFCDGCSSKVGSDGVHQDSVDFARWYNARRAAQSPLQMTLTGVYNRNTRQGRARVVITATGNITQANLRIRYLLLENLPYFWGVPPDTLTGIDQKQRDMLPDAQGVPLTISNGQTRADSQSFTMQPGWRPDSTHVAVFVQSDSTREILQGAWTRLLSFSGAEQEPDPGTAVESRGIDISPNPFTSHATIPGHAGERFALYDATGRQVGVYKGDRIGEGLRAGVYFLRPEGRDAKPVRIVKLR